MNGRNAAASAAVYVLDATVLVDYLRDTPPLTRTVDHRAVGTQVPAVQRGRAVTSVPSGIATGAVGGQSR